MSPAKRPLLTRSDLRLALTAGLLMLAIMLGGAIIAILYPILGKAMPVPIGAALAMACARLFSGVWLSILTKLPWRWPP